MLLVLMKSSNRGQILFALGASFLLGTMIAHQLFPATQSAVAWAGPVLGAVFLYALTCASSIGLGPQAWREVLINARALPVDWITFGAGGAVLGYWISARIHEMRRAADDPGQGPQGEKPAHPVTPPTKSARTWAFWPFREL